MEIILKFDNLQDAQTALDGQSYSIAFFEFDQYLRSQIKYNDTNLSEDAIVAYSDARSKLRDFMFENGIKID
jgi:hypothetical protein